jgi:hypothetical protein
MTDMNSLALLSIGLGLGLLLALMVIAAASLLWAASRMFRTAAAIQKITVAATDRLSVDLGKLQTEVSLHLSRMDAERIYECSLALQQSARTLKKQIGSLQSLVYASSASASPAIDTSPAPAAFSMDDEAVDDARMVSERNRWLAGQEGEDPLAGLSEEEKQERVSQFFARRRHSNGSADAATDIHPIGAASSISSISSLSSTPPVTGAYASLLERSRQQQSATSASPLPDLDTAAEFDGEGMGGVDDLGGKIE